MRTLASTLFVVDQRQVAVIYALGEIKEVVTEPGLNDHSSSAPTVIFPMRKPRPLSGLPVEADSQAGGTHGGINILKSRPRPSRTGSCEDSEARTPGYARI